MRRVLTVAALAAGLCSAGAAAAKGGFGHHGGHADAETITLNPIGSFDTGGEATAEISAYDAKTMRLFVVNPEDNALTILSLADPASPTLVGSIPFDEYSPNSVAVKDGVVAVALEAPVKTDNGRIAFYNTEGVELLSCEAGALPDMVTFSPNGAFALVANEGEPNDDYDVDPEGSVTIVAMRYAERFGCDRSVRTVDFNAFDAKKDWLTAQGVRIFGPGASVSQDLEPEYITVSDNSHYAWVSLQENNALALIDIWSATVEKIIPLGVKDHSLAENGIDPSNRDDAIAIAPWPVVGMYQPDAIANFTWRGTPYVITANEGDARDYDGFSEEARIRDLFEDGLLDMTVYSETDVDDNERLGRLNSTTATGDTDGDGLIDVIHVYGARSFSIWGPWGGQVYDSGDDFEQIIASQVPDFFNANDGDPDEFDNRSDDKGPEPEGVVVGRVGAKTYAFIGLERGPGGVMVYELSSPYAPEFVEYVPGFGVTQPETGAAEDVGPEGMVFISKKDSPNGQPLLVLSNEVSGTIRVYAIESVLKD